MSYLDPRSFRSRALRAAVLVCTGWAAAWATAQAQPQPPVASAAQPIPVMDFVRRPQFTEMVTSPSGRYIATTRETSGRLNLVIIDIEKRSSAAITNFDDIDIGGVRWVGDDRLVFSAIQINAPSGQDSPAAGGLFTVGREGQEFRQLAQTRRQLARNQTGGFVLLEYQASIPGTTEEIIAAGLIGSDESIELYRVNLLNGRYRLHTPGRPADFITRWIMDSKNVARIAVARGRGNSTMLHTYYRPDANSPWKEINRFDTTKFPAWVPLAFEPDGKHLIVSTNDGRTNMAIYRYDPEKQQMLEQIAQHPQYDLGASPEGEPLSSLITERGTGRLIGIRVDADTLQTVWLDDAAGKMQAAIDAALPGRTNVFSSPGKRFVVTSFSDRSPGRFLLYDADNRRLEDIGLARPWLEGRLAAVRPFRLKTRDGLEIPSYYVLPPNHQPGQKLPTVVHIHGGPFARDVVSGGRFGSSFGISEAQILASRGYAVVLPNFRITPELGSSIYYAGFGTYGRQMLDDHEDAVAWAVSAGFADPGKVCISGASYGGYAALQALTRPSNPFKCAIAGLPVTDLPFQHGKADYAESPSAREYWLRVVGVESMDSPMARALSPINNAASIKVPVFMYVGDADTRTPPAQARRMADALAAAGNPVKEYFVGKGEGHGFGVTATRAQLNEQILKFLAASVGP
ncbi:MAG: prolyl oligopeptidase family serine peptidase [Betaproteobacteria bacterium]